MSSDRGSDADPPDRTIIMRPTPGGRAAPSAPFQVPGPGPIRPSSPAGQIDVPPIGLPPLLAAAGPLLLLLAQLRNIFNPPDPAELRQRTIGALRRFDVEARANGLPQEVVHPARYALCASIDDAVLNTNWGGESIWVQASLVSTLHQEVISGEGFFHVLASLKRDPARNLQLLTLMYFCLSLGYQGQYRLSPRGPAELDHLREDLYAILQRFTPPYEAALSLRWLGMTAPYRPARARVPIWVMGVVSVFVIALAWAGCRMFWLAPRSTLLTMQAASMAPAEMPRLDRLPVAMAAPPPPPAAPWRLAGKLGFLQPQIDAGEVAVQQTPHVLRIIIFDLGRGGMFDSGRADIRASFLPLLTQIGDAIEGEPGRVTVTGHTDNVPIHTLRFPSNYELSVARANAAADVVRARLKDPARISAAGYAAEQPRDTNDTELGRAHNRRIEIIMQRPSS